jgi:TolB protein
MRLTVAAADGTDARDLGIEIDGSGLAWSPDGTTLLYVGQSHGEPCCATVSTVGLDGEGGGGVVQGGSWQAVTWAPDGSRIALAGHPAIPDNVMGPEGWDIYTVALDGSELAPLTRTEAWEHGVSYSPDGSTILFTRSPNHDDADYHQDVWVMDVDGSNERKLTDWEGFDGFATWSPDGEWIVFASDRDATREQQAAFRRGDAFAGISLFVMRADGTDVRRILTAEGDEVLLPGSWKAN